MYILTTGQLEKHKKQKRTNNNKSTNQTEKTHSSIKVLTIASSLFFYAEKIETVRLCDESYPQKQGTNLIWGTRLGLFARECYLN